MGSWQELPKAEHIAPVYAMIAESATMKLSSAIAQTLKKTHH